MSEKAEVEKVARQVAERFAETGDRPKQQLERMVERGDHGADTGTDGAAGRA